jgi:hypothetical protein
LREAGSNGEGTGVAITVQQFLYAELVAAAALALWTVGAFPRLGPRTARSTVAVAVCAFTLLRLLPLGVRLAVPHGFYVTLFGLVLPALYLVFLFAAWTLRHFANLLGGRSGGGPGHRVPVTGA